MSKKKEQITFKGKLPDGAPSSADIFYTWVLEEDIHCDVCKQKISHTMEKVLLTKEEALGKVDPLQSRSYYTIIVRDNKILSFICPVSQNKNCWDMYCLTPVIYEQDYS